MVLLPQSSSKSDNTTTESEGNFNRVNRTAVIISGQIRSANLTFKGGNIIHTKQTGWFGPDDPLTPSASIIKHMLEQLANTTGLDVFMYVDYEPKNVEFQWDGKAASYQPSPRDDHAACKIFSNSPIFHNHTGNHFFCLYEQEKVLMTSWIANYTMWENCQHKGYAEQVLQQLYGMYQANQAAIQYAHANHIHYAYKIRLRPDTAIIQPFPDIRTLDFSMPAKTAKHCKTKILFSSLAIFRMGNPDWFNVGLASDMNHLLNRYLDFVYEPFPKALQNKKEWILEEHLMALMQEKYGVCLHDAKNILMIVVRKIGHAKVNHIKREVEQDKWKELST